MCKTRAAIALMSFWTVAAGRAAGDLTNGDFTGGGTPPTGWSFVTDGLADYDVVSAYGGSSDVLKLTAENTETETDSAITGGGQTQQDGANYVPPGTTALRFQAAVEWNGGESNTWPIVDVSVFSLAGGFWAHTIESDDAAWRWRTLDLTGIDPGYYAEITVRVIPESDEIVQVAGYFDNFQFIPEPATLILLGVGVLGLRRRRS